MVWDMLYFFSKIIAYLLEKVFVHRISNLLFVHDHPIRSTRIINVCGSRPLIQDLVYEIFKILGSVL